VLRLYGRVHHRDEPVEGAYVRLLGPSGEFTAELRTDETGKFLFYPVEGEWTLVGFAPGGGRAERRIRLAAGQSLDVDIEV
jgi:hypothetical protein